MKRKIYFLLISLYIAITGHCQFNPVTVNYPNPGYQHWPDFMSVVDASQVWLGISCYTLTFSQVPFSWAVKTTDGGNTWIFDSIPVPGQPYISSLFAVDDNTCFYVFTDNGMNGSIWKTSDGGTTWTQKTTTQFSGSGGFADFYCAFDLDEGVALGDPTSGYFEIQRTTDGGETWNRVNPANIPPILPGEAGLANVYSAVGDIIWFASYLPDTTGMYASRCFKSTDRGQHWTVSPIISHNLSWVAMCFSTAQKGVLFDPGYPGSQDQFYRTSDGGSTWTLDSISIGNLPYMGMSAVPGIDGGFVVSLNGYSFYSTKILFTPDFFSTIIVIDSNLNGIPWGIRFNDASTGWLEGNGTDSLAIWKYSGLLTAISNAAKTPEKLAILPNPTSTEALVKLPGMNEQGDLRLIIYNASGQVCENRLVGSTTGWIKINASGYSNGVYILKIVCGDRMIAQTKWVVQH
jgi:photosystem II stability/assembly factor-like uncharacterized protein